ncbi:DUF6169 family protein [Spirosoma arboris]|nr:DUF6169 family protein [Spirosoma arboris]
MRNVEDGFLFETDFGITYAIRFTDDSGYIPESSFVGTLFSFSITPIAGQVKQKDPRVEQTVIKAILLTFEALPTAVINYVCSLDDDQEVVRSRLFHRWYLKAGTNHFVKFDQTDTESRIFTSVIFSKNHPAEEEIRRRFDRTFDK